MTEILHAIVAWIVDLVATWGYSGVFLMMFVESSFVPFPSEAAMIPAGYLASQGKMSATLAVLAGIGGSLCGALLNYQLALRLGRPVLERVGRYFFLRNFLFFFNKFFRYLFTVPIRAYIILSRTVRC